MDRDAEKMCRLCHAYQVVGPPAPPPLVKTTPLPNGPWGQLAADLLGPLPGVEYVIGRARKIRAHSRILRLEREVLRPVNFVQSQLCA